MSKSKFCENPECTGPGRPQYVTHSPEQLILRCGDCGSIEVTDLDEFIRQQIKLMNEIDENVNA